MRMCCFRLIIYLFGPIQMFIDNIIDVGIIIKLDHNYYQSFVCNSKCVDVISIDITVTDKYLVK